HALLYENLSSRPVDAGLVAIKLAALILGEMLAFADELGESCHQPRITVTLIIFRIGGDARGAEGSVGQLFSSMPLSFAPGAVKVRFATGFRELADAGDG